MAGNVVNSLADLKAIGVGTPPFTDGFNVIVKDIQGDGSILPLTYIWLDRVSVASGLKIIKPNNNLGGWYLMRVLGDALPASINATTLEDESGAFYRDRTNHTGFQSFSTISGLGNAATKNVGTGSNDVAAGDDARFGQATNALSFDGQPSSYFLSRANHTGNIALGSLDLLTGYSVGSAVAIDSSDSILSAFGKAQAQLNNKPELVGGLIPSTMLPSYVDDVLEFANLAAFPVTGESGKLYIAIDTNLVYRWTGSTYAGTSSALALGETSTTAYRGDRGKTAYDHSLLTSGNPHSVTKTNVGLGNCDNTADANKPVSTAQQTALDLKANANNAAFTGTATGITASMVGLGNVANLAQVDLVNNQTIAGNKTFTGITTLNKVVAPFDTSGLIAKFGGYGILAHSTNNECLAENLDLVGGSWKYINSGYGSLLYFLGGELVLFHCPSGTAGATIAPTQRLKVGNDGTVTLNGSTPLKYVLSSIVTWDIPSTAASSTAAQTFTVTGANVNDFASVTALDESWYTLGYNGFLTANVSATNTVKLRWNSPPGTVDPISATFRILVIGF